MKKLTLLISALMATMFGHADEGMWTLYNLPEAVYDKMVEEGFDKSYNSLYHDKNAIKNAVVNFSGFCSGVVVSPNGLVFTNHHCGFEAIRKHSTVENDYMRNGFYAKTYEEELPNEGMFVSFMKDQTDVPTRLHRLGLDRKSDALHAALIDSLQQVMTDSVRRIDSTLHVEINAFYEGNSYYATTYQEFRDLRLVFTIPKSMGKFGGETDNWMWPRQTCDFAVFRIYANPKTNGPAEYSKDNVPYRPEHWAKVSMDGYEEGDFAMTMGYPGSTNRYLSSFGIKEMRDAQNAPLAQVRGVKQEVMVKHMRADNGVRIKYDSKYAQSSNYWKNALGMNKCIDSIGIITQKQEYEQRLRQWQEETGFLKGQLDFDKLQSFYEKRADYVKALTYWSETFRRTNELTSRAMRVNTGMEALGDKNKPKKMYHLFADNSEEWDAALDKEVLAVLLKNYREHVSPAYLPAFYKTIDKKFGGNYTKYVDYLYAKSLLMKPGAKLYFNTSKYKKDPGVLFGQQVMDVYYTLKESMGGIADSIALQEKHLCAAKLRMEEDMPHYSDANFTMRLSYGQIGGFDLGGKPSGYYTVAESIVEKMNRGDKQVDYQVEPIMKELLSAKDFGRYTDSTTGKMQLCFLTNNDITGGNSGSTIFNGNGDLIGLAFDGNWDSLSSDINFDARLARCIGVDIRFMLFMMDKWGKADRLIKELGIED